LVVKPKEADFSKDVQTFGTMDPYTEIVVGKVVKKTKVHDSGGKTPKWNDELEFNFNLQKLGEEMQIKCFNTSTFGAGDMFASTKFNLRTDVFNK